MLINYRLDQNQALIGRKNLKNLEKVQRGMDSVEVKSIMGEPFERNIGSVHNEMQFDYQVPPRHSYDIVIVFNLEGKVEEVYPNKEALKNINENYFRD